MPFNISVDKPQDGQHPLIRFTGRLKNYEQIEKDDEYNAGKKRLSVKFNFVDVTVIDSHEPYPFPITDVTLAYSDRSNTRWAEWAKSYRDIVPEQTIKAQPDPLAPLLGKMQEWFFKPGRLRLPVRDEEGETVKDAAGKDKWAVQDADTWQIVSLEGFTDNSQTGGKGLTELIVEYADGKKDSDIYSWIYSDQSLKSMPGFNSTIEAAAERTLMTSLVTAGKLTVDGEGVYHAVVPTAPATT